MEANQFPPEDYDIRKKAKSYAMFADGVRAYLASAFRRGATAVRIRFSETEGSLCLSDNGRPLTKRQIDAFSGTDGNAGRSEYEKLALALVTHGQYVMAYNGEGPSVARFSMPSTRGWCLVGENDDAPAGPVQFQIFSVGRPECSIAHQKRDAETLIRILPAMLSPAQRKRVTVVDRHGTRTNLGLASNRDAAVSWTVEAPKQVDCFTALDRIGWNGGPVLVVGGVRVSVRKALDARRASSAADWHARLLPLASPWLGASVNVSRGNGTRAYGVPADDFPEEAYADGTVDAILEAVARTNWPRVATEAVESCAERLLEATRLARPFPFRGTPRVVRVARLRVGLPPDAPVALEGVAGGTIFLAPLHPVFQVDAYSRSIHDRILWCVADLLRGDAPVHAAYLELRAATETRPPKP